MRFIKKHPLFFIFFFGLILRLSLLFLDYSFDVNNHIAWGKDLFQRGPRYFYDVRSSEVYASAYPNYPPLVNGLFFLLYPVRNFILSLLWPLNVTFPIFPSKIVAFVALRLFEAAIFKIPSILADLGVAAICYTFAKKLIPTNKKWQLIAPAFILFNPVFLYNSAYQGQIDAIPLLLVLFSYYLLIYSKKPYASMVYFVFAFLIKPTAIVYALPYSIYYLNNYSWRTFIKAFLLGQIIFWISFLPFYGGYGNFLLFPYSTYYHKILEAQSLAFVTNGALNLWAIITQLHAIPDSTKFIFGIPYKIWGYLITGILIIFTSLKLGKKNKDKTTALLSSSFFIPFAFFLFMTKMHDRYIILALPFLVLMTIKNRTYLKWYILISIIGTLNMYMNWPVPNSKILQAALHLPFIQIFLSLTNIALLFYLLRVTIPGKNTVDKK